jgi:hypothetical protein
LEIVEIGRFDIVEDIEPVDFVLIDYYPLELDFHIVEDYIEHLDFVDYYYLNLNIGFLGLGTAEKCKIKVIKIKELLSF